jgi:hypothetical protein
MSGNQTSKESRPIASFVFAHFRGACSIDHPRVLRELAEEHKGEELTWFNPEEDPLYEWRFAEDQDAQAFVKAIEACPNFPRFTEDNRSIVAHHLYEAPGPDPWLVYFRSFHSLDFLIADLRKIAEAAGAIGEVHADEYFGQAAFPSLAGARQFADTVARWKPRNWGETIHLEVRVVAPNPPPPLTSSRADRRQRGLS